MSLKNIADFFLVRDYNKNGNNSNLTKEIIQKYSIPTSETLIELGFIENVNIKNNSINSHSPS